MEKLNRAQKCSILGPQNLGSGEGPGPRGPPWIRTCIDSDLIFRILDSIDKDTQQEFFM